MWITCRSGNQKRRDTAIIRCEIIGKINERVGQDGKPYAIGFRLRLPVDWNGRFFFQGGGGLDGSIGNALGAVGIGQTDNAISRGYMEV